MTAVAFDEFTDGLLVDGPGVGTAFSASGVHAVPQDPEPTSALVNVRVAPLVDPDSDALFLEESAPTETVMDMQLIVDYTSALARRTAARVKAGQVDRIDQAHQHPTAATCLRCAVLSTSRDLTLASTLLELMVRSNADEEWNCSDSCTDTNIISRLRRLAVSSSALEDLYGPRWGEVMLMCLRIEASDFALLHHLVKVNEVSRVLVPHTRYSLAAHHLAQVVCPHTTRGQGAVTSMLRGSVAVRLAVTAGEVAVGRAPAWLDHLPAPVL